MLATRLKADQPIKTSAIGTPIARGGPAAPASCARLRADAGGLVTGPVHGRGRHGVSPFSSGAQVAQHREARDGGRGPPGASPSLVKMLLICFSTAPPPTNECAGDGGVRPALGHQREHLTLARGELAERVAAAGEQLRDDFGIERAAARGHPVQRVEELGDVRDPVLEQVADPLRGARRSARWRTAPRPTGIGRGRRCQAIGPGPPGPRAGPSSVKVGGILTSTTTAVRAMCVDPRAGTSRRRPRPRPTLVPGLGEQPGQSLAPAARNPPRSLPAWQFRRDDRGAAGRGLHREPPVHPGIPGRPGRNRPGLCTSAPPMPSSLIMTVSVPGVSVAFPLPPWAWLAPRVLGHVGERLGHHEVGDRLHRGLRPHRHVDVHVHRDRAQRRPGRTGPRPGPRSVSTGGCTPGGRGLRSSVRASLAWAVRPGRPGPWRASGSSAKLRLGPAELHGPARPRPLLRGRRAGHVPSAARSASAASTTRFPADLQLGHPGRPGSRRRAQQPAGTARRPRRPARGSAAPQASSTSRPITAEGRHPWACRRGTKSADLGGRPLGSNELYSGSVSMTRAPRPRPRR